MSEDFLISAIAMADQKLDRNDFLVHVLEKIQSDMREEHVNPQDSPATNFQSRTLTELTRRILLEKQLKTELAQVTEERNNLRVKSEQRSESNIEDPPIAHHEFQRALQAEHSLRVEVEQMKKNNAIGFERQADELRKAVEERDAALKSIDEERKSHQELEATNTRLKSESARQEDALRKLENIDLKQKDLVIELRTQKDALEQNVSSLKLEVTEYRTRIHNSELVTPKREPPDASDNEEEQDSESEGTIAEECGSRQKKPQIPCGQGLLNLPNAVPPKERFALMNKDDSEEPIPLPMLQDVVIFNREFLSAHLGGGTMPLQVSIANKKKVARDLNLSFYLCPNLDHNPWAPSAPGTSGLMFVGLGQENGSFSIPETHEVFVQFAPKQMFYAGTYECKKVEDLRRAEWDMLDIEVKKKYSETTRKKSGTKDVADVVLRQYDEGVLRAPCVQLKCTGFNWKLYESLSAKTAQWNRAVHSGNPSGPPRTPKRKRTSEDARAKVLCTPEARQKRGRPQISSSGVELEEYENGSDMDPEWDPSSK